MTYRPRNREQRIAVRERRAARREGKNITIATVPAGHKVTDVLLDAREAGLGFTVRSEPMTAVGMAFGPMPHSKAEHRRSAKALAAMEVGTTSVAKRRRQHRRDANEPLPPGTEHKARFEWNEERKVWEGHIPDTLYFWERLTFQEVADEVLTFLARMDEVIADSCTLDTEEPF